MSAHVLAVSFSDVVAVIALILAAGVVVSALAGVVLARRLKRPLLLAPGTRVAVPLRWRWSLSPAAVMHRRLVLATSSVLSMGPVEGTRWGGVRQVAPWQELLQDLLDLAVSVDRRLVATERQPRALRRRLYAELEPQVAKVEQVAERMRTTIKARGLEGGDRSPDDVVARLDAIDAALGEIESIDPARSLQQGGGPGRTPPGAGTGPPASAGPASRPGETAGPGAGDTASGRHQPGAGAGGWGDRIPWPGHAPPERGG